MVELEEASEKAEKEEKEKEAMEEAQEPESGPFPSHLLETDQKWFPINILPM